MIKQGHVLICSSLVILHADGLDFAAEVGVIADAQIGRHLAQTAQHAVACDLLQGPFLPSGYLGWNRYDNSGACVCVSRFSTLPDGFVLRSKRV